MHDCVVPLAFEITLQKPVDFKHCILCKADLQSAIPIIPTKKNTSDV